MAKGHKPLMAKGHKPKKIKPERDEAREERISMEIIVDAYGEEERAAASSGLAIANGQKPTASGDRQFSGARSAWKGEFLARHPCKLLNGGDPVDARRARRLSYDRGKSSTILPGCWGDDWAIPCTAIRAQP